ncbi:DeoR family transcriptional regulator [Streptomyces cellulosae]|uniref:DeoR family transcriptional regulator n=1 Tax=Streptomyces cellulosae TaxID=1968 RepID=UPI000B08A256|nr:DeoR family transcriptional regulator [Streptomyces cellulosae]
MISSKSTIRRDLTVLDRDGGLLRAYGGAALPPRGTARGAADEEPFDGAASHDRAMKEAMAEQAAALVADESVVVRDIGTTTALIARRPRVRPVTHRVVLVASEAKSPGTGSLRLCSLSDIDVLITTGGADPRALQLSRQAGGQVLVA